MLYDKRWDKTETKPSLAGFISWLEQQNPQERYQYMPCHTCAIGQYVSSIGLTYADTVDEMDRQYFEWNMSITQPSPWTFGAALARAKALQP